MTATAQGRVPGGVAAGGQFTASQRSEPHVTLTDGAPWADAPPAVRDTFARVAQLTGGKPVPDREGWAVAGHVDGADVTFIAFAGDDGAPEPQVRMHWGVAGAAPWLDVDSEDDVPVDWSQPHKAAQSLVSAVPQAER